MKLVRCENGHFFDAERFTVCPHCNPSVANAAQPQQPQPRQPQNAPVPQKPQNSTSTPSQRLTDVVNDAKDSEDLEKTIGYFGEVSFEPVVGWLVAIEGKHFGEDFKLKTGRNFIGRAPGMDVQLSSDSSVSRERHAIVLYEPKNNIFLVQPGDSKELFYLNDSVVLSPEKIKSGDVLTIGASKLLFVPCCTEAFNWDMVKKEEKE